MFQNDDFSESILDGRRVNQVFCAGERNVIENDTAQSIYKLVRDNNGYIAFYEVNGGVCIGVDDHTEGQIVNNNQLKYKLALPPTYSRNTESLSGREVIVYETKSKAGVLVSKPLVQKRNNMEIVPLGFENIAYTYPVDIVLNEKIIGEGSVKDDMIEIKSCKYRLNESYPRDKCNYEYVHQGNMVAYSLYTGSNKTKQVETTITNEEGRTVNNNFIYDPNENFIPESGTSYFSSRIKYNASVGAQNDSQSAYLNTEISGSMGSSYATTELSVDSNSLNVRGINFSNINKINKHSFGAINRNNLSFGSGTINPVNADTFLGYNFSRTNELLISNNQANRNIEIYMPVAGSIEVVREGASIWRQVVTGGQTRIPVNELPDGIYNVNIERTTLNGDVLTPITERVYNSNTIDDSSLQVLLGGSGDTCGSLFNDNCNTTYNIKPAGGVLFAESKAGLFDSLLGYSYGMLYEQENVYFLSGLSVKGEANSHYQGNVSISKANKKFGLNFNKSIVESRWSVSGMAQYTLVGSAETYNLNYSTNINVNATLSDSILIGGNLTRIEGDELFNNYIESRKSMRIMGVNANASVGIYHNSRSDSSIRLNVILALSDLSNEKDWRLNGSMSIYQNRNNYQLGLSKSRDKGNEYYGVSYNQDGSSLIASVNKSDSKINFGYGGNYSVQNQKYNVYTNASGAFYQSEGSFVASSSVADSGVIVDIKTDIENEGSILASSSNRSAGQMLSTGKNFIPLNTYDVNDLYLSSNNGLDTSYQANTFVTYRYNYANVEVKHNPKLEILGYYSTKGVSRNVNVMIKNHAGSDEFIVDDPSSVKKHSFRLTMLQESPEIEIFENDIFICKKDLSGHLKNTQAGSSILYIGDLDCS
ncbi:TcfC E-set like domain-containing protein [Vibrio sp. ZSDZ65]|uniref:TcfC E-set like domain-containing protein n=1 Tax=Vibrio qingdaonensis TaxID=2829491 RepID=A0A9X3CSW2_9VIBR|nr:TcfC E-set like domain-containing protein [Vibrio qingdaonensis]MCW8349062.1 TcfC E-set like domain-containing protein [Vibrio qingdaonensis]